MRFYIFFFFVFFNFSTFVHAQTPDSVKISGIVISADSMRQVPNATIQRSDVFTRYRADTAGYFSIFAYPADTITFTSVGYNTAKFVVPQSLNSDSYSLVESLVPDSLDSSQFELYPMPTAKEFVNAFKDQSLLYADKYEVMRQNIERIDEMEDEEAFLSKYRPMDINFGYGRLYNNKYAPIPSNNFLNPVRWRDFIEDLQNRTFDSGIN